MYLEYFSAPTYATIISIVCIVVGLAIAVAGYRFRRAGLAAVALFAAGDYITNLLFALDGQFLAEPTWYYPTYFAAGAIFAVLGLRHVKSGVVVAGFSAGVLLASVILRMADYRGATGWNNIALTIGGLICAPLIVVLKKRGLVAATSFVGAYVFTDGVYYFVSKQIVADENNAYSSDDEGNYSNGIESWERLASKLDSAWWTITAILFAFAVVAAVVQLRLTARNIDHDNDVQQSQHDELPTQYADSQTPHQNAKAAGASKPILLA